MPQTFILLNTTVLGTTTFPAGSSIDGNSDPIDQLRAAGGVLIPPTYAPPSLIAATERALQARSRGAGYQVLDQIMLSGLGARTSQLGGGSVFIYREGETNPGGNVFSSFDETLEAATQTRPSTLFVDSSLGVPIVRGVHDVDTIMIEGGFGVVPNLTMKQGARLTGTSFSLKSVGIVSESTEPVIDLVGSSATLVLDVGSTLNTTSPANGPLIHVDATSSVFLVLRYFSFIFGYAVPAPILGVDLGGSASVFTDIATAIFDNVLAGDGSIFVDDLTGIAVANRNTNISHVQLGTDISYGYG